MGNQHRVLSISRMSFAKSCLRKLSLNTSRREITDEVEKVRFCQKVAKHAARVMLLEIKGRAGHFPYIDSAQWGIVGDRRRQPLENWDGHLLSNDNSWKSERG